MQTKFEQQGLRLTDHILAHFAQFVQEEIWTMRCDVLSQQFSRKGGSASLDIANVSVTLTSFSLQNLANSHGSVYRPGKTITKL